MKQIVIDTSMVAKLQVTEEPKRLLRRYVIEEVRFGDNTAVRAWSQIVDFSEIFNSFCRNHLVSERVYRIGTCEFRLIIPKGSPPNLNCRSLRDSHEVNYDKFDAGRIYNKLTKILNKCDFGEVYELDY